MNKLPYVVVLITWLLAGCGTQRQPAPPPWYVEHVDLAQDVQLPRGLSVREPAQGDVFLELAQAEAEPVYLLTPAPDLPNAPNPPLPIPPGYRVAFKLDGQQVYLWDPTRPAGQQWVTTTGFVPASITRHNLSSYSMDFAYQRIPIGANRPTDAVPPAPQRRIIRLIVGQQLVALPLELRYELNPDYARTAEEYRSYVAHQQQKNLKLIMALIIGALGALFILAACGFAAVVVLKVVWTLVGWAIARGNGRKQPRMRN